MSGDRRRRASVFVKLFHTEDGSDQAQRLLEHAVVRSLGMLAAKIMMYEALGAALHYSVPFRKVARPYRQHPGSRLRSGRSNR